MLIQSDGKDGKEILVEEACIESLSRLKLLLGRAVDDDGKRYYLISAKDLKQSRKPSNLRLTKVGTGGPS